MNVAGVRHFWNMEPRPSAAKIGWWFGITADRVRELMAADSDPPKRYKRCACSKGLPERLSPADRRAWNAFEATLHGTNRAPAVWLANLEAVLESVGSWEVFLVLARMAVARGWGGAKP